MNLLRDIQSIRKFVCEKGMSLTSLHRYDQVPLKRVLLRHFLQQQQPVPWLLFSWFYIASLCVTSSLCFQTNLSIPLAQTGCFVGLRCMSPCDNKRKLSWRKSCKSLRHARQVQKEREQNLRQQLNTMQQRTLFVWNWWNTTHFLMTCWQSNALFAMRRVIAKIDP